MEELDELLVGQSNQLLNAIQPYQRKIIEAFLDSTNGDYLASADKWLNATPTNTATFGGKRKTKIYRDKLLDEIEKFLCGDATYDEDRRKISDSSSRTQQYIIGVMSVAIGKVMGVAGTFIAPVIVLLMMSFGKMSINAWCAMRKAEKST
jgi:hypothetical protein